MGNVRRFIAITLLAEGSRATLPPPHYSLLPVPGIYERKNRNYLTDRTRRAIHTFRGGSTTTEDKLIGSSPADVEVDENRNETSKSSMAVAESISKSLSALHLSTFLVISSMAMVAFSPVPALESRLGSNERALTILSRLTASAAAVELLLSPMIGLVIDSVGRKRSTMIFQMTITMSHFLAAISPSIATICISKMVILLMSGFLVIITNAFIGDLLASDSTRMGAELGTQSAAIGLGFLIGALAGGRLVEKGEGVAYGIAGLISASSVANIFFQMSDSRECIPFDWSIMRKKLMEAPISSTKLLMSHGKCMRILSIIFVLQSVPAFMGDLFQVYAKTEWELAPKDFSNLFGLFGCIGIVANMSSKFLIQRWGVRSFTLVAVLSTVLFPFGTCLSYKAALLGGSVGFLGSAQKIGTISAMGGRAYQSGLSQGQLAGERASMTALFKIICPLIYSALYVQGKKVGVPNLHFIFNIGLAVASFILCWLYL